MDRSWSSPAPAPARPGSSSSASDGCSRRRPDLQPEKLLVLTYNVKAARELRERIDEAVGPATAARMTRLELPQLLPSGPARERGRCGHAAEPGRARRHRPAAADQGPAAGPRPDLPRDRVEPAGVREVHQPREGRARHAGRLRRLRRPRAARSSRTDTAATPMRPRASSPTATSSPSATCASAYAERRATSRAGGHRDRRARSR